MGREPFQLQRQLGAGGTCGEHTRMFDMLNTARPRIDIQRRSRGLASHFRTFKRISGPGSIGRVVSLLIIGFGQVWACMRKHRELMRSGRRTRVLLISFSG